MSTTRTGHDFDTQAHATTGARTILRAKTVATRLSIEELEEVEAAAKRSGKSLAEWLRDTALTEARPSRNNLGTSPITRFAGKVKAP